MTARRLLPFAFCIVSAIPVLTWSLTGDSQKRPTPTLTVMGRVADTPDIPERKALEQFSSRTGVKIRFAQSLQTVDERINLLSALLTQHSPEPDLLDLDVIWAATLGSSLVDLTPLLRDEIQDFAPELLRNFIVDGRLVAIPTLVNAGVLYYRSDLLKKYKFSAPPETWEDLDRMATVIQAGERRGGQPDFWGYLWQGGAFESLTCNALEWQASSGGGEILGQDQTVHVYNPKFVSALKRTTSWIGRISPPGEPAFGEDDGMNFWLAGKAAFMRNWTGVSAELVDVSGPMQGKTSVALLPGGEGGRRGTLGGSGTGISVYSAHREQALEALKILVSETTQKKQAAHGFLPARTALRRDPESMAQTPLQGNVADEVIKNLVARPALRAGPSYTLVSRAYYNAIHSILKKEVTPEEGLARLQTELVKITGFRAVSY